MEQPKYSKLNLGCGETKKEGYINVDFHNHVQPDVVHDLNVFPYPFPDNSFELVELFHTLEHLDKPFLVMKEVHRIMKNGGTLHIKAPHFSRGFTHPEHKSGFDLMFPQYFNKDFTTSGYFGVDFDNVRSELHWLAHPQLLKYLNVGPAMSAVLKTLNAVFNFLAKLDPRFCSRFWCFWVGGFEEIEFEMICRK